jgi:hypothetical protein
LNREVDQTKWGEKARENGMLCSAALQHLRGKNFSQSLYRQLTSYVFGDIFTSQEVDESAATPIVNSAA